MLAGGHVYGGCVTQGGASDSPCLRALAAPGQGLEVGSQHPCWVLYNLQLQEISAWTHISIIT